MGVKIFPSRPFKKIIGVSLPNTSETFCMFLQKTHRNRHPIFAGCVVLDVLVVQPGCQNSIILIADKVPIFLKFFTLLENRRVDVIPIILVISNGKRENFIKVLIVIFIFIVIIMICI